MAYDQLMQTYLGVGLLADRPSAPNVKAGVGAFYYGTDTAALYVWDGATWHTLAGGSTTLAADTDVAIASPADTQVLTYVAADGKWENKPAAGGTSGALTKIGEVIVGVGGAATIAFSSIPGTYRSLQIRVQARSSAGSGNPSLLMQINGDTGANYDRQFVQGFASTVAAQEALAQTSAAVGYTTIHSGAADTTVVDIVNYSNTTFRKSWTSQSSNDIADSTASKVATLFMGNWRSTAAITSILLFAASGNFVQGSVASLYGIS